MTPQRIDLAFGLPPGMRRAGTCPSGGGRVALLSGNYIALLEALWQVGELTRMLGAR